MSAHPPRSGEESFGLDCWDGQPLLMHDLHWHPEVEINHIVQGEVTYLAGGRFSTLGEGQVAVFWGALPHRVVLAHADTVMCWLTLPLPTLLGWGLNEAFVHSLLNGDFWTQDVHRQADAVRQQFEQWAHDLSQGAAGQRQIVLLEVEARLRRVAGASQPFSSWPQRSALGSRSLRHVESLVSIVAERYAQPLSIRELARQVGLHPHYAMTLFKSTLGLSLQTYLTQHRIAHAQRLLATGSLPILDVADACGFSSTSQFYELFKRSCGQTPRRYRAFSRTGEL
ncbi:helix-turn-helix domain-containing protein [Deinococcus sp.]|uniref:helix-turn-helix domain-containing protein n=1 Tax=Deinococcus sp. TaxID=47478 RepID=UPI003CC60933